MNVNRWVAACALAGAVSAAGEGEPRAWASSKDECLEAHGRAQDLRDAGHLTSARQSSLSCAQTSCPALIQADCARLSEELERLVPSVSFAARDPSGLDIPDTAVFVDDQPVATRLDDGKTYELDPGRHAVRFLHDGHATIETVVLVQGDKGRSVVAVFGDAVSAGALPAAAPSPSPSQGHRPGGPLLLAGLGAAAAATGVALVVVGLHQVPDVCSMGSGQCVAPPGDPSLDQAHRAVTMANLGLGIGLGGVALLATGTFWYFAQPEQHPTTKEGRGEGTAGIAPFFGDRTAGVAVHSRF